MTVAELIVKLQKLPQELKVYTLVRNSTEDACNASVWKVESCDWMEGSILDEQDGQVVFIS